jgi:hypothetical protein
MDRWGYDILEADGEGKLAPGASHGRLAPGVGTGSPDQFPLRTLVG